MAEGDALDQKCLDYRAWITWTQSLLDHQSRTCVYAGLSEMIATVHQRVITVEIKQDQNASAACDEVHGYVFKAFYNARHVASSKCSIDNQTTMN